MTTRDPESSSSSETSNRPPSAVPDAGAPQEEQGEAAKRFNDSTGCLSWNRRPASEHPGRCKCQGDDPTPHKHYDEPPYACARCSKCDGFQPITAPAAHQERTEPLMAEAAAMLWEVLANVSGGDWTQQSPEWQEAARHWRDYYFEAVRREATADLLASLVGDASVAQGIARRVSTSEMEVQVLPDAPQVGAPARAAEWRTLLKRMRSDASRFCVVPGGERVVSARTIDDWADDIEELLPPGALAG